MRNSNIQSFAKTAEGKVRASVHGAGRLSTIFYSILLAGCGHMPAKLHLIKDQNVIGSTHSILVATNREPSKDLLLRYSDGRSDEIRYDNIKVWVPSDRNSGSVAYPSSNPVASREFGVLGIEPLSRSAFAGQLQEQIAGLTGSKLVFLFVHGYNVTYPEGIYRHAQLMEDFDARGIAVHFSWPSSGRVLGYLHDRDSVQFARDGLVAVIEEVAASGADSIFLMGHSMGTLLVMESLRQLSLSNQINTISKVSPLVLASPTST